MRKSDVGLTSCDISQQHTPVIARGFILQATYRVARSGAARPFPILHLYGRLTSGESFLVRDGRRRPRFHVRATDVAAARALGARDVVATELRTFDGEPVARVSVDIPADVPALRDRLTAAGIDTFEADVRFPVRYLIEHDIKGACEIEGEPARSSSGSLLVFDDPVLRPADVSIEPRVLSFDIETDPRGERLLAISLYAPGFDEVLIVSNDAREMPVQSTRCVDERDALDAFCERVRTHDPDVITGWNVIDFDLTVLQRIAERLDHPFLLGRDGGALRLRKAEGFLGSSQATIPGRLVLEGIDLLRGAFVRMEDYSLDAVAHSVLGEGKTLSVDSRDRAEEILRNYHTDLGAFALYARTDARLAYEIPARLKLIALAFARSKLTGMTPDRVGASIASFDFVYLSELGKRGIVAPTVRPGSSAHIPQQGGHVIEPRTGLHREVWVFDFKSLYPNIIRTFNIDPLAYVPGSAAGGEPADAPGELIETPGGAFRRIPAILPALLDELFPRREAARHAGDGVGANAIKILMNSFYGVLGTSACRFFNPALANAITGTGKHLLLWSKAWFERAGFEVLYGDTDSLFVRRSDPEADGAPDPTRRAQQLAADLNVALGSYIRERWGLASRLELEFEKRYERLFLPPARHGLKGASKRYAGLLRHGASAEVEFVGMEVVRSDWTQLAREVQRELYRLWFTDQPVEAYLSETVAAVRRGEKDALLVYRKNLRKRAESYTATTPPHVAAARKSPLPPGRYIRYAMTTDGPEPVESLRHPLDREHYVVKQIRPVAEPVLKMLGLSFERLLGERHQAELPF